jgi:hypothetical protein
MPPPVPIEVTCRMRPDPWARRYGTTAWLTQTAPKKLTSRWARICSSVASSTIPYSSPPALLTTTSSLPKAAAARLTPSNTAGRSETSSGSRTSASGYSAARSASGSMLRAEATTRSPAASAASVNALPRPREAPVMNQTLAVVMDSHLLFLG